MRVLFTATSGRGHVSPMVPLGRALLAAGHDVAFATDPVHRDWLTAEGFLFHPAGGAGPNVGAIMSAPDIQALPPQERPDHVFGRVFGPERAGPMLADLLPFVAEWPPELIVADQGELAAPIVAAVVRVPVVTHSFGPLLPAIRLERGGEAMAPLWREQGLEPPPYAGMYESLYLDIYPPSLAGGDRSHLPAVQPLRPVGEAPRAASAGDPLVYVTFGTVFNKDPAPLRAILDGLDGLPVSVLVTVGADGDPAALGERGPNVRIERFVPQAEVLPGCAAVIAHGGSGSFLAALAHGLPQLLIPQAADQFLNAAAAARSGAGLVIGPGELTAEAVRAAVGRLLGEPEFAAAAARGAEEIAAMPGPDEVADLLVARFAATPS